MSTIEIDKDRLIEMLRDAFLAGFAESAEGWNYEYPGNAESTDSWEKSRYEAIRDILGSLA